MKLLIPILFFATVGGWSLKHFVFDHESYDDYVLIEFAARLEEEDPESFEKLSEP